MGVEKEGRNLKRTRLSETGQRIKGRMSYLAS